MRRCHICGREMDDTQWFCPVCGAPWKEEVKPSKPTKKKAIRPWVWAVALVGLLAILIASVVLVLNVMNGFSPSSSGKDKEDSVFVLQGEEDYTGLSSTEQLNADRNAILDRQVFVHREPKLYREEAVSFVTETPAYRENWTYRKIFTESNFSQITWSAEKQEDGRVVIFQGRSLYSEKEELVEVRFQFRDGEEPAAVFAALDGVPTVSGEDQTADVRVGAVLIGFAADAVVHDTLLEVFGRQMQGIWVDLENLRGEEDIYFDFWQFDGRTMTIGTYVGQYGDTASILDVEKQGNVYTLTLEQGKKRETVDLELTGETMVMKETAWTYMGTDLDEARENLQELRLADLPHDGDEITVSGVLEYLPTANDLGKENCYIMLEEPVEFWYEDLQGEKTATLSNQAIFSQEDTQHLKAYVGMEVEITATLSQEVHGLLYLQDAQVLDSQAEARPWAAAYLTRIHEDVSGSDKVTCGYSLQDLDDNGVPELFLKVGTSEADYVYSVYTYDGQLKKIGTFSGSHSAVCGLEEKGQFLVHTGIQGSETVDLYTFDGKELTAQWLVRRETETYYDFRAMEVYTVTLGTCELDPFAMDRTETDNRGNSQLVQSIRQEQAAITTSITAANFAETVPLYSDGTWRDGKVLRAYLTNAGAKDYEAVYLGVCADIYDLYPESGVSFDAYAVTYADGTLGCFLQAIDGTGASMKYLYQVVDNQMPRLVWNG